MVRHFQRLRGMLAFLACGVAALAGISPAQAQAPVTINLPEVVVTPSRIPATPASQSLGTQVITREEIDAQRPTSMIDLLRHVPGLHIDQPGGRGGISSIYMRGGDPNFTLVLIDGVRVNDPTNSRGGSFNFNTLDPGGVERIEIVPGPLSALYGSDAMAGAINIITRDGGDQRQAAAQIEGGGLGYYRGWAGAGGPAAWGSYSLDAAFVDDGKPVEGNSFTGTNLNASARIAATSDTSARMTARYSESRAESYPDDSGGPMFAVLRQSDARESRGITFGGEIKHEVNDTVSLTAKASHFNLHEWASSPGVAPGVRDPFGIVPNSSDSRFNRETVSAYASLMPSQAINIVFGGEAIFERGSSDSIFYFGGMPTAGNFALTRHVYAPFGELRVSFPTGLTAEVGFRVDYPDAFDREISPRAGVRQVFDATGTTFSVNWGKGFKLPSFYALSHPIVGNVNLVPESSESIELAVEQKIPDTTAKLRGTLFHNRYGNLIDFDAGPPPRLVNRSQVTAKGYEIGIDIRPMQTLSLAANLTYTSTEIDGTGLQLRSRPKWRSVATVRWLPREDLTVAFSGVYVGTRLDSSIPTGDVMLNPYTRFDVAATWRVRPEFELSFALENVLNTRYQEAVGFPVMGIRPRLIGRASF